MQEFGVKGNETAEMVRDFVSIGYHREGKTENNWYVVGDVTISE